MSQSSFKVYFVSLETHFLVRDTIVREIQCLYDFRRNSKGCYDRVALTPLLDTVNSVEVQEPVSSHQGTNPLHNPQVKQKSHQKLQFLHLYLGSHLLFMENKHQVSGSSEAPFFQSCPFLEESCTLRSKKVLLPGLVFLIQFVEMLSPKVMSNTHNTIHNAQKSARTKVTKNLPCDHNSVKIE